MQGIGQATSSASRSGPAVPVRHLPLNRSLRSLGKAFRTRQRLSLAFPRWGRCPHGRRPSEASRGRMRSSPGFASFFYCNRDAKPSAKDLIRLAYGDPPSPYRRLRLLGKAFGCLSLAQGSEKATSSDLAPLCHLPQRGRLESAAAAILNSTLHSPHSTLCDYSYCPFPTACSLLPSP